MTRLRGEEGNVGLLLEKTLHFRVRVSRLMPAELITLVF